MKAILLLLLCFVVQIFSSQLPIGSNLTCFDVKGKPCYDLTTFHSTPATRKLFHEQGYEMLGGEGGFNSSFVEFFQQCAEFEDMYPFRSDIDVFAIYIYPNFYSEINYDLRVRGPDGLVNGTYYWLALGMAAGITKIAGTRSELTSLVWRSESDSLGDYVVNHNYLMTFMMSTSYSRYFALTWDEEDEVFLIISNSQGVNINHIITGESEVLFAPGLNFNVLFIRTINGPDNSSIPQVFLYEINNNTYQYTAQQRKDLLAYMIKQDKIHALNDSATITQSMKKAAALKKLGKNRFRDEVPSGWYCDQSYYDNNDGCDCNCGEWDPDCDKGSKVGAILNCMEGGSPVCDRSTAKCSYTNAPSGWTCDPSRYNSGDGCDCGCGEYDPDCKGRMSFSPNLSECEKHTDSAKFGTAIGCDIDGYCMYSPPVPREWFCSSSWFGTNDGCDCNCGAIDPDCEDVDSIYNHFGDVVMNCPCESQTCVQGKCFGECSNEEQRIIFN